MKNLGLICLLLFTCTLTSQEKLKKAKNDLSATSTKTQEGKGRVRVSNSSGGNASFDSNSQSSLNNDKSIGQVFGEILFFTTLGTVFGAAEYRELNPYPYYNYGEYTKVFTEKTARSNFRIGSNYLMSTVKGLEINALYKPLPIIGIETSFLRFSERNSNFNEYLHIGSLLANFYRVREKYVTAWWGIGVSYVGDEVASYGFTYSLGTEIYPLKPISLHLSWKESFINSSTVGNFKLQLKYHLNKLSIQTGFHHHTLGEQIVKGVVIGVEYTF